MDRKTITFVFVDGEWVAVNYEDEHYGMTANRDTGRDEKKSKTAFLATAERLWNKIQDEEKKRG